MFLLLLLFPHFFPAGFSVEFNNIQAKKGSLYIAVYDRADAFLQVDKVRSKKIVPVSGSGALRISFDDLPPGWYALSCFHDVNNNGKLDTNFLGIPSEPYGFSNNARPKFRAPNWSETVFEIKNTGQTLSIRLDEW